jgi:DNA-binding beta-propeller fold protein YncE
MLVGRRALFGGVAGTVGVAGGARGQAVDPSLSDIRRYVYVPSAGTAEVTVIDADTDRIAGSLPIGVIARHVVVSREAATLVATDASGGGSLVNVFTGSVRRFVLPAPADQLTIGTNGLLAAAVNLATGTIAVIGLDTGRVDTVISGLPPLRDVMFGTQDTELFIAAEGLDGVGVVDVGAARLVRQIGSFRPARGGVAALARTANGRQVLAQPKDGGPIGVIDLDLGKPVGELAAGGGTVGIFPSGTGGYLFVPDTAEATLAVFRSAALDEPVVLRCATDAVSVHTAWLDSVAFVPCAGSRRLLVYDLDPPRLVGEIPLTGTPLRGVVTPDSRTLYLPLLDPPRVVAVDGSTRRIGATFDLPGRPLSALVAGASGLCH